MKISKITENVIRIGDKAAKWLVLGIFSVFTIILFCHSMLSTSVIDRKEHITYVDDSVVINILLLVLLLAVGIFLKIKKKTWMPIPSRKVLVIVTIIYVIGMAAMIATLKIVPTADQGSVLRGARSLLEGNFEEWQKGGYLYNYPNQNGIVLVFALLCTIFGELTWVAIQFLNVLALVVCAFYCSRTIRILFDNEKLGAYSYIFLLCFLGMNCYATFVYGTVFGMTVAACGIYHIIKYIKERNTLRGIIGVVLVAISFLFKENYLIFAMAALLLLLYDAVFKKKIMSLFLLINGILVCLIVNMSISVAIESITNTEVSKGVPSKAWVAMGLQEGIRAPGWYNGYNLSVFVNNGYDYEKASEVIDKDIESRVYFLKENTSYTIDFFNKKIMSQWNEGTFQGLWIMETRKKAAEWSQTLNEIIYSGNTLNNRVVEICDFFLSFLWLGVVLFLALGWRELDIYKLIYAIVFIGGFIFHLFWEGKGQYTVVYVYFLIPYMARGYQLFFDKFTRLVEDKMESKSKVKNKKR